MLQRKHTPPYKTLNDIEKYWKMQKNGLVWISFMWSDEKEGLENDNVPAPLYNDLVICYRENIRRPAKYWIILKNVEKYKKMAWFG